MRQGIFDQKSWDEKEEEKQKPNPAFRVRWGPEDVLIHRPTVRPRSLDEGSLSLTRLHLSAVENVTHPWVWMLIVGRRGTTSAKVT